MKREKSLYFLWECFTPLDSMNKNRVLGYTALMYGRVRDETRVCERTDVYRVKNTYKICSFAFRYCIASFHHNNTISNWQGREIKIIEFFYASFQCLVNKREIFLDRSNCLLYFVLICFRYLYFVFVSWRIAEANRYAHIQHIINEILIFMFILSTVDLRRFESTDLIYWS